MHDYEPRSHENKNPRLESKRRTYTNDRRRTRSKGMRQEHTVVPNEPQSPQFSGDKKPQPIEVQISCLAVLEWIWNELIKRLCAPERHEALQGSMRARPSVMVRPELQSSGIQAQAIEGKTIEIAREEDVLDASLMKHEARHIVQQRLSKHHAEKSHQNRDKAESEADQMDATLSPCSIPVLRRENPYAEDNEQSDYLREEKAFSFTPKLAKLGQSPMKLPSRLEQIKKEPRFQDALEQLSRYPMGHGEYLVEGKMTRNPLVLEVQQRLYELGYLEKGMDGSYVEYQRNGDPGTTFMAIQKYQKANGLPPTGKVDRDTMLLLIYDVPQMRLGRLSAAFESKTDGIYAIGWDKEGGTSYGRTQFSSRKGIMDEFVRYLYKQGGKAQQVAMEFESSRWPEGRTDSYTKEKNAYDFDCEKPEEKRHGHEKYICLNRYDKGAYATPKTQSTGKMTPIDVWQKHAPFLNQYAEEFKIEKYYTKPMKEARNEWGKYTELWDMIECTETLQEVFLSTAIQHGQYGVINIFITAYKRTTQQTKDTHLFSNKASKSKKLKTFINPSNFIKEIYLERNSKSNIKTSRYNTENQLAQQMYDMETLYDTAH